SDERVGEQEHAESDETASRVGGEPRRSEQARPPLARRDRHRKRVSRAHQNGVENSGSKLWKRLPHRDAASLAGCRKTPVFLQLRPLFGGKSVQTHEIPQPRLAGVAQGRNLQSRGSAVL